MTPSFVRFLFVLAIVLFVLGASLFASAWLPWKGPPLSSDERRIATVSLGGGIALALIAWFGPRIDRIEVKKARSPWDPPDDDVNEGATE